MTGTNGHANQGNGGTVGEHQDATLHRGDGAFYSNSIIVNNTPVIWDIPNADKKNSGNVAEYAATTRQTSSSTHNLITYASRPTNTSLNYMIKVM